MTNLTPEELATLRAEYDVWREAWGNYRSLSLSFDDWVRAMADNANED